MIIRVRDCQGLRVEMQFSKNMLNFSQRDDFKVMATSFQGLDAAAEKVRLGAVINDNNGFVV